MSPELLLKSRYKVIADFPESCLEIGEILTIGEDGIWETEEYWDRYPHLFKKLSWWEDRAIEDLPMYLKLKNNFWQVYEWKENMIKQFSPSFKNKDGSDFLSIEWHFYKNDFMPASKEDFEIQQQK